MEIFRRVLIGLVTILGLLGGGGYYYTQQNMYEPSSEARKVVKEGRNEEDYLFFEGKKRDRAKSPLLTFYPGALVDPESYSIWTQDLARNGYSVAIVKMPLDLAMIGGNKANKIKEDLSDSGYVIGGHSLGGVVASRYADKNRSDSHLKRVFLMASYPDKKGTLEESAVPVLSITAAKDKVLSQKVYKEAKQYLSERTEYILINGGNYGGFGSYGKQKGDGEAGISNADQQTVIVNTLENQLKKLK